MGTLAGALAAIGANAAIAAAAWSPLALFAASENGVWYDPSDFSSMFQDAAGTVPVTAPGDPVGKILDKSGNGHHATQSTAGNRPTLAQDVYGAYHLTFTGTQHLSAGSFAWGSGLASIFSGHGQTTTGGATNPIWSFGDPTAVAAAFWEVYSSNYLAHTRRGSGSFGTVRSPTTYTTGTNVTTHVLDLSGATHATEQSTQRNFGLAYASGSTFGSADTGSGSFGTQTLYLGRVGTTYYSGRLYGLIARAAASSADEITAAETWMGNKSGTGAFAFTETLTPTQWSESRAAVDATTHYESSVFGYLEITTTSMQLEVDSWNDIYSTFSSEVKIGVWVDTGSGFTYHSTLTNNAVGAKTHTVSLGQGSKTVRLVTGMQSKPSSDVIGTYVTEVRAAMPMTQDGLSPSNRLLVYGDSIASGAFASNHQSESWIALVRAAYAPDTLAVEAWGYRALYDDAHDATARAAFVSLLASYAPAIIWLAIGTNDYGLNKWSASAFGTAYAALLDDLHTALPSAAIYCQTPLLRTNEASNGSGSTTGDYRTAIATAQSTRSSYATLVDGTAIMTTASLTDGVHPSTAGHALYASAVQSALGI